VNRKAALLAVLAVLLLSGVAFADSVPGYCPSCHTTNVKAFYTCPNNARHNFTVWPAWYKNPAPAEIEPVDWHCPTCDYYPCVGDSIVCMIPSCGWKWSK